MTVTTGARGTVSPFRLQRRSNRFQRRRRKRALNLVTEFRNDQFGGVGIDHLIDGRHHAIFQGFNNVRTRSAIRFAKS